MERSRVESKLGQEGSEAVLERALLRTSREAGGGGSSSESEEDDCAAVGNWWRKVVSR